MVGYLRKLLLAFCIFHILTVSAFAQVPTVARDLNVTAVVPPNPGSIEFDLSADYPEGTELAEDQEVTFTVSYRSTTTGAFPLEIEAYWEQGLIEGSGGSYVDVYEYVVGSASNAHDGSPAVVDLLNNKITWQINNFASSPTPKTVTFKLRVRSDLPTTNRIEVYTKARGEFAGSPIPEQTYQLYAFKNAQTPSITPTTFHPSATPGPGAASGGGTKRSTPTPTLFKGRADIVPLLFNLVQIEQLTEEYVQISAELSMSLPLSVTYGQCGKKLTQIVALETDRERHIIDIHGLTPDTVYCFQLKTTDVATKRTIISDIFTFKTASDKEQFQLADSLVTWNNIILNTGRKEKLVAPSGKTIVVSFNLGNPQSIDEIIGSFELQDVLGASTLTMARVERVPFIEISPGMFSAEIMLPERKGEYNFMVEIKDVYGSFMRKPLPVTFVISDPIKVINSQSKRVIENAVVSIDKLETSTQRYKTLGKSFALPHLENGVIFPYHTDQRGYLDMILPSGKYKVEVSAVGYESKIVDVSLGIDTLEYPVISLQPRLSPESYMRYTSNALKTTFAFIPFYGAKFFSTRLVLVTAMFIQVILFLLSLVGIAIKQRLYTHILSSGKKATAAKLCIIQVIKIFIIIATFISIIFMILFTMFQNLLISLPFVVSTILLILLTVASKTKEADLK